MESSRDLATFLRSRRDRLRSDQCGLPVGRRRSPGLRRTEVAQMAGISIDYYVRLEQGRSMRPSPSVLSGLAQALRLTPDERDYLYRIAAVERPAARPRPVEPVRPGVLRLLEVLMPVPAIVIGRTMDVLAWNDMGAALLGDFESFPVPERNLLWQMFCEPAGRALYADWASAARHGVARLRLYAAGQPGDQAVAALVRALSARSPEFRRWWVGYEVQDCGSGRKGFNHPVVGRLDLDWEALLLPEGDDQYLVTYTASADSAAQASLDLLAVLGKDRADSSFSAARVDLAQPSTTRPWTDAGAH